MKQWLQSKAAKIIITAMLSGGLMTLGLNPQYAAPIVTAVSQLFDVAATSAPVIIKEQ